jgi:hypothetical protein
VPRFWFRLRLRGRDRSEGRPSLRHMPRPSLCRGRARPGVRGMDGRLRYAIATGRRV